MVGSEVFRFLAISKIGAKEIRICNSSIKLAQNQRMNIVFHNRLSDKRRPVRVMRLPENIVDLEPEVPNLSQEN